MNKAIMLPMKLTTTAFKRKQTLSPATSALEEALRLDCEQNMLLRQRKRPRTDSSTSGPYTMSSLLRETRKLESSIAFPTIEWCFDDDEDDDDDEASAASVASKQEQDISSGWSQKSSACSLFLGTALHLNTPTTTTTAVAAVAAVAAVTTAAHNTLVQQLQAIGVSDQVEPLLALAHHQQQQQAIMLQKRA